MLKIGVTKKNQNYAGASQNKIRIAFENANSFEILKPKCFKN